MEWADVLTRCVNGIGARPVVVVVELIIKLVTFPLWVGGGGIKFVKYLSIGLVGGIQLFDMQLLICLTYLTLLD